MGRLIACFLFIVIGLYAYKANAETVIHGSSPTGPQPFSANTSGQATITLLSGEDQTNSVFKVEQQFSYKAIPHADTQVDNGPGFLHSITCATIDGAAATAGTIILHDALTETTPNIQILGIPAAAFEPFTVILDVAYTTGLYVGYTTTADVDCVASYR